MKKILFVDRDGTVIVEPPVDRQVDSLDKLKMVPGVLDHLGKIAAASDYELVMVTNQDGLGTKLFPEETFWPAHNEMLKRCREKGIVFKEVLIDRSLPEENAPTRKPRTELLRHYQTPAYDLKASFVVGDRLTDMQLAKNLGARGIWFGQEDNALSAEKIRQNDLARTVALTTNDWETISRHLLG